MPIGVVVAADPRRVDIADAVFVVEGKEDGAVADWDIAGHGLVSKLGCQQTMISYCAIVIVEYTRERNAVNCQDSTELSEFDMISFL